MFISHGVASLFLPCRKVKCEVPWGQAARKAVLSTAGAPTTMERAQWVKSCRLATSLAVALLVVVGCFAPLLLLREGNRSRRVFYTLRLVQPKQGRLFQPRMQQHESRALHKQLPQQEQPHRHQCPPLREDTSIRGGASATRQTEGEAANGREAAAASTKSAATSRGVTDYSPPPLKRRQHAVEVNGGALFLYPSRHTKYRYVENHLESSLLSEALSSNFNIDKPLRLLPWSLCGPPLLRAPALANAIYSFESSAVSSTPVTSSSRSRSLSSFAPSFLLFSLSAADVGGEESAASYVSVAAGGRKPSTSYPLVFQDALPTAKIVTTPSSPPAARAAPRRPATLTTSLSAVPRREPPVPSTISLRTRRPPESTHSQHRTNTAGRRKHRGGDRQQQVQQLEELQEGLTYSSFAREESELKPRALLHAASSGVPSFSFRSPSVSPGAFSRRLAVADTLIQTVSQFVMYPEMGKMLEGQLRALKRAFRGESTLDLKIPVYLSAVNNCLVAFDFIADQDNGDNFHLGRVSPGEIEIFISYAEHQGLLKYKERRQESTQIAKLPVVHVQRFDLPKNCLSTANASWTAYCSAPAPKACYVGRVDLHLSSLGDEDELTAIVPVPFTTYVESQMQDGVSYSEILDRVEAPTPLLHMLFDKFRCLLHFRFHSTEPSSTRFFWLRNRQGIRVDVSDADTNAMAAKKTSIPALCGAEQPKDIQATWTELPDGSYKALVKFRQYFEYEKVYTGFVKVERKEPDKRPEEEFDYYNEKQVEFDKFFSGEENVIPLVELPRVRERQ